MKETDVKTLRLCGQVARILNLTLAGEGDELLQAMTVQFVVPAPNASRLLVTVCFPEAGETLGARQALERLNQIRGRLRSEVAAAIRRKRAPELTFRLAAPP